MRTLVLSAVLLAAATAVAQPPMPPKVDPPKPDNRNHQQVLDDFVRAQLTAEQPPAKGSVEEAILTAQRHHPDIRLAEAKRQMADAEVEQAKFLVAQRVAGAFAKIEQAKALLVAAEDFYRGQKAAGTKIEAMTAFVPYQKAKGELTAAELELKAATGGAARTLGVLADPTPDKAFAAAVAYLSRASEGVALAKAPVGGVADKLKALLDKPVKLDLKAADLDEAMAAVLKAVGESALTVKLPTLGWKHLKEPPTATITGEMTFTAALEFVMDEYNGNGRQSALPNVMKGKYEVYVREYGLLIARAEDAPKDAPTLTEFARQVRAAKPPAKK